MSRSVWIVPDHLLERFLNGWIVILCPFLESPKAKSLCVEWDDGSFMGCFEDEEDAISQLQEQGFVLLGHLDKAPDNV
jgi:hypothetical protein